MSGFAVRLGRGEQASLDIYRECMYGGRDLPLFFKQTEQDHKGLLQDMFRPRVGHHQSQTLTLC